MGGSDASALIETLRAALAEGPALHLAVLFGSGARGALRPASDVDIGILPLDGELPLRAELDLQARLSRACAREVDLIRLDLANAMVRWEAAVHGIPILSTPASAWSYYAAQTALEHAEMAPGLSVAAEIYRRRTIARCVPGTPSRGK